MRVTHVTGIDVALNDVEVPERRCGQMLKLSEYKHGECETCRSRLRLPCVEPVSPRIMRRYRRPS